jgi:regulatory protein
VSPKPEEPPRDLQAALAKAADLLARRDHFRAELARKLAQRAFPAEVVARALDRLGELGHLDDATAARRWAEGAVERKGFGPRRLLAELTRRGVAEEDARAAAAGAFPEGERAVARRVAARCRRPDDRAAVARHLDRKGFSSDVIIEILGGLESEGT